MLEDIKEVLVSEEQLKLRISELGAKISEDYKNKNLLLISVLKGAVIVMADLMRQITIPMRIDFMAASSYGNDSKSSGRIKILNDLDIDITGYDLLIVEDILDSGKTLASLIEILRSRNPRSIKVFALLSKPERRQVKIDVEYEGFVIPDEFAVGYGLDYAERYRNLPFIGALKEEIYTNK